MAHAPKPLPVNLPDGRTPVDLYLESLHQEIVDFDEWASSPEGQAAFMNKARTNASHQEAPSPLGAQESPTDSLQRIGIADLAAWANSPEGQAVVRNEILRHNSLPKKFTVGYVDRTPAEATREAIAALGIPCEVTPSECEITVKGTAADLADRPGLPPFIHGIRVRDEG